MDIAQTPQFKFIQALVTTLRQISIYPARHPSIIASMKNILSSLNLMFMDKDKFTVNISPDKSIFFDGQPISQNTLPMAGEFGKLFERLGVEELAFARGVTEEEINEFIQIIVASGSLKDADIKKLFGDKAITHIEAKQFSYLKVEKGMEAVVGGPGKPSLSPADELKQKVKAFCQGEAEAPDARALEKDIFGMIADEIKEKGKPSAVSRDLLKKFLAHGQQMQEVIGRLRQVLAECGVAAETVDEAVQKLTAEPAHRRGAAPVQDEAGLGRMQEEIDGLRRTLEEKEAVIGRLERENKKAYDDKHRIDNIIHNLAEGMVVVDSEGKILLANSTAENLLGITAQDVGKPVKDVVRDEHLLTMTKDLTQEKDGTVQKDIEFVNPSEATKKVLRTSSAVVEDKNGNTIGMVTMLNDITRQKELERMKSGFLANVTHELRTPLIAVEKSISLILQKEMGEISGEQAKFLGIAERNLKRLSFLINDLLDLAKFEAGRMELKPQKTDIEKLIGDCVGTLGNWAQTKQLSLARDIEAALPPAWADANRLMQVLVNLTGNAIKFTPGGGTITLGARREGDGLRITVEDTGPGIPPDELERIFEKFYQTKQRSSSDISGTGIGLAVVREIVNLHGGRVWAESDGSHGARFIFTIQCWNEAREQKEAQDG